jgi:hypothetical protein
MVYKGILWYSLLQWYTHSLECYTKGLPIEYQKSQRIKANKGITKDQRIPKNTKGLRNTIAEKRREKEKNKSQDSRQKNKVVFLFVALPQKNQIKKKVLKRSKIVLFGYC